MASDPWDFVRELSSMQERMNRLWGSLNDRRHEDVTSRGSWAPPVDIYETDSREVVLKADLPGLKREDIDLTVEDSTLTITGQRRPDEQVREDRYHRLERASARSPARSRFQTLSIRARCAPTTATASSR